MFMPMLKQLKVFGVRLSVNVQLSELPLFTKAGATVTVPFVPKLAVTFLQRAVGKVTSFRVTVKEQLLVLPLPSLAVRVTSSESLWPLKTVPAGGVWVTVIRPLAVQLSLKEAGLQVPTVPVQEALAGMFWLLGR
jgi:hypothetical protein